MEAGQLGVPGPVIAVIWETGTTSFQHAPLPEQEPAQILLLLSMESIAQETAKLFILKDLQTLHQLL